VANAAKHDQSKSRKSQASAVFEACKKALRKKRLADKQKGKKRASDVDDEGRLGGNNDNNQGPSGHGSMDIEEGEGADGYNELKGASEE
jgi:hypothetical protein